MTGLQRLIKYFSIALAISIIVGLIVGVLQVFNFFSFSSEDSNKPLKLLNEYSPSEINSIEVSLKSIKLEISEGQKFEVKSNSKYINLKSEDGKLSIKEKNHLNLGKRYSLVITIPENTTFDSFKLSTASGSININNLYADKIDFDLGAGSFLANNLNVYRLAKIDGGAGKIEIKGGTINNLDFDIGVGEAIINSLLLGNNNIDCGVGRLELNLIGDDYNINIDSTGSSNINGKSSKKYGIGDSTIKIDGGIGNIEVETNK